MADITVTAAQVAVLNPEMSLIFSGKLAVAVTKGQALYQTSSGTWGLADANASAASAQLRGLALEAGAAGAVISILKRGFISGYTLGTIDSLAYLSNTAGALADATAAVSVPAGIVATLPDASTKVLWFEPDWLSYRA